MLHTDIFSGATAGATAAPLTTAIKEIRMALAPATLSRLRDLADTLGGLNAEITLLERQATAIKAEIAASGERSIRGSIYEAAVVITERQSIDAPAVRAMLGEDTPMKSAFVQSVRIKEI